MEKIKIAIIELGTFHDECLYSQLRYLEEPYIEVCLIGNKKIIERLENLPNVTKLVALDFDSKFKKYKAILKTWRFLKKEKFHTVLYNTAESNIYKLISLKLPSSTQIVGTIHNAKKINSSKKQKTIDKRLSKCFVLNEYIKENIIREQLTLKSVAYYYPIFFPTVATTMLKPLGELWVVVPGMIDFNKRDFDFMEKVIFPENLKIIFLGKPNGEKEKKWLLDTASKEKNSKNIICFNTFIPEPIFYQYIKNADYIMPLIHPNIDTFESFLKYKISGSYNIAIGFKKTLLLHEAFSSFLDFKHNAVFYTEETHITLLQSLKEDKLTRYQEEKWDFQFQKKKYLNFIFN